MDEGPRGCEGDGPKGVTSICSGCYGLGVWKLVTGDTFGLDIHWTVEESGEQSLDTDVQ